MSSKRGERLVAAKELPLGRQSIPTWYKTPEGSGLYGYLRRC